MTAHTEKPKKRDVSYELIRVLAMFFIIFDHNLNPFLGKGSTATTILEAFFTVGVTLFFMLSGKFAFKLNLEDKSLYKKYYWKKVIGLIIPMLVYMAIKEFHVMSYNQHLAITPISYIKHLGISIVNGYSYMEYWFLYTLMALLIAVPFTARMMQSLKDSDKKAFLIVSTIMATLATFIPITLKVNFAVEYYFISYVLFFYIGFIVEDIFKSKSAKTKLYIAGLLCFITTLVMIKFGFTNGYKSFSPFYLYFTVAMFVGLRELGKKIPKALEKFTLFLGKHSLSVYMIHMIILYTINDFNFFPQNVFGYILSTLSTIIISILIGAIIDNTLIKALQKLCIKIFRLEKVIS